MSRLSFIITVWCFTTTVFAASPTGFLWYQLEKDTVTHQTTSVAFETLPAKEQVAVLSHITHEALARATLQPSKENAARYLAWQQFWIQQASRFQQAFLAASVANPTDAPPMFQAAKALYDKQVQQHNRQRLTELSQHHGLWFFYRSAQPVDQLQASVINDWQREMNFPVLPISVDGEALERLPSTVFDRGQAQQLNIQQTPALVLVNPATKHHQLISQTVIDKQSITDRIVRLTSEAPP